VSSGAGDPYLDPASGVLRNLLGITDAAELAQAEASLSTSRLIHLERRRLDVRISPHHALCENPHIVNGHALSAKARC